MKKSILLVLSIIMCLSVKAQYWMNFNNASDLTSYGKVSNTGINNPSLRTLYQFADSGRITHWATRKFYFDSINTNSSLPLDAHILFTNDTGRVLGISPTLIPISKFINDVNYIITELDPTVPSYVKSITTTNISNWNASFGWGNWALQPFNRYFPVTFDTSNTNEIQTISKSGNNVTLSFGGGSFSVADQDSSITNELQTLSISGTTITLSNNGGSISLPGTNASVITNPTRVVGTSYQLDTTKTTISSYTVSLSAPLAIGTAQCVIEISSDNVTFTVVNSIGSTATIALLAQSFFTLQATVPPKWYVRMRAITTLGGTATYQYGQDTKI